MRPDFALARHGTTLRTEIRAGVATFVTMAYIIVVNPAILEAGVVGRADPDWGAVPVAAIVLQPGITDPGDDELRSFSRERLAAYKVPVAFIRLGALPRTTGGKLRREALREVLALLPESPAAKAGVKAGDAVKVTQGNGSAVLVADVDARLPANVVRVPAGTQATSTLGASFGAIRVEKA